MRVFQIELERKPKHELKLSGCSGANWSGVDNGLNHTELGWNSNIVRILTIIHPGILTIIHPPLGRSFRSF
jgi:hypothetical protein